MTHITDSGRHLSSATVRGIIKDLYLREHAGRDELDRFYAEFCKQRDAFWPGGGMSLRSVGQVCNSIAHRMKRGAV